MRTFTFITPSARVPRMAVLLLGMVGVVVRRGGQAYDLRRNLQTIGGMTYTTGTVTTTVLQPVLQFPAGIPHVVPQQQQQQQQVEGQHRLRGLGSIPPKATPP